MSVNQQCLLDRVMPVQHVRAHNIRKAQSRALRGGNIHTLAHHTQLVLCQSSINHPVALHIHTLLIHGFSLTHLLTVFAGLVQPASYDRHMDLSRYAKPQRYTAKNRAKMPCSCRPQLPRPQIISADMLSRLLRKTANFQKSNTHPQIHGKLWTS